MNRITRLIDELNDEELQEFERDIKTGVIQKFLEQKKEYFKIQGKACAACGNQVTEECYVLIFGSPKIGLRKKAHFCGSDCLIFFLHGNSKGNKEKLKNDL